MEIDRLKRLLNKECIDFNTYPNSNILWIDDDKYVLIVTQHKDGLKLYGGNYRGQFIYSTDYALKIIIRHYQEGIA